MAELWKDIVGYEGLYQVSNLGRIRSFYKRRNDVEFLKFADNHGYKTITLHKDGRQKTFRVHRLVAVAFLPNESDKPQINHINGNKSDNRASNLEWCSQSENMLHAYESGLQTPNTKEANAAKRKLNAEQAQEIRTLLDSGKSTRAVAKIYGVGKNLISRIGQGKAYSKEDVV